MDEDDSDSYPSSDEEEKKFARLKGKFERQPYSSSSDEETITEIVALKRAIPQKIIKSTKIILSLETKNKIEEQLKEKLKKEELMKDDKKNTDKSEVKDTNTKIEDTKITKIDEDQNETEGVGKKEDEKREEMKPVEDKDDENKKTEVKDKEAGKEEEKGEEEKGEEEEEEEESESELEDEDGPPKQKKLKTSSSAPETSEYDPKNVHYAGEVAIYTDPKSGYQYKWCKETNQWLANSDVTYGFEDDVHTYTDTEGVKYFWDVDKNAWFPKIDDDFMARYQMSYGFTDTTTKDNKDEKAEEKDEEKEEDEEEEEEGENPKEKTKKDTGGKNPIDVAPPSWFEMSEQVNTKVYVSNLPTDITEEEFVDLMQKCGLVMRDLQTGKMKVKLYTVPETDILKGDGLCTYIRIESVELALNLLDGSFYRGKKIKVERAKFEMKGSYNPNLKPKKRRRKDKDKLKKMQEKLFDWRPEKMRGERSKHERVVIIKNLFEPSLFDKDVSLILEYQEDLREECGKCGEVKRVFLYDRHPEGVAQITMKLPEQADEVVTLLNGRWFGQRKITAEIWDGKIKYKIAETDAEITQRIDKWDKFLESDDPSNTEENKKEKSGQSIVEPVIKIQE